MSETSVVLLTGDARLRDAIMSVATAASVAVRLVERPSEVRERWRASSIVLVGIDRAVDLAATTRESGPEVYLVGGDDDVPELLRWSVPLGAAVLTLPGGVHELTSALTAGGPDGGRGAILGVVGGSGGSGSSTLAAAVAGLSVRRGASTTLVDLDERGGGLDLLLGAEQEPGWRWPRLSGARGHLDDLAGALVDVDGLKLLAMGRGGSAVPHVDQLSCVLAACSRQQELTVVDLPRSGGPAAAEVVRRADLLVVVVRADVRGLAAAQQVLAAHPAPGCTAVAVRGRGLEPSVLADRLGAASLGVVQDEPAVRRDAERGHPPGRSSRSTLQRVAARALECLDTSARARPAPHRYRPGSAGRVGRPGRVAG